MSTLASPQLVLALLCGIGASAPALAQDRRMDQISESSNVIDSLSPRSSTRTATVEQLAAKTAAPADTLQLNESSDQAVSTGSLASPDQSTAVAAIATGERTAAVPQTAISGDLGTAVPAPPPELIDACELAALGLAVAPSGIDCSTVLVAVERASTRELAELSLDEPTNSKQSNEVSIRRLENASPEEIARRLASGYLVNAPAAQNVGRLQQEQSAGEPALGGITVTRDPRSGSGAVQVNPGSPR
jgi:hypothetical protein